MPSAQRLARGERAATLPPLRSPLARRTRPEQLAVASQHCLRLYSYPGSPASRPPTLCNLLARRPSSASSNPDLASLASSTRRRSRGEQASASMSQQGGGSRGKRAWTVQWRNFQARKNKTWESCVPLPLARAGSHSILEAVLADMKLCTSSLAAMG